MQTKLVSILLLGFFSCKTATIKDPAAPSVDTQNPKTQAGGGPAPSGPSQTDCQTLASQTQQGIATVQAAPLQIKSEQLTLSSQTSSKVVYKSNSPFLFSKINLCLGTNCYNYIEYNYTDESQNLISMYPFGTGAYTAQVAVCELSSKCAPTISVNFQVGSMDAATVTANKALLAQKVQLKAQLPAGMEGLVLYSADMNSSDPTNYQTVAASIQICLPAISQALGGPQIPPVGQAPDPDDGTFTGTGTATVTGTNTSTGTSTSYSFISAATAVHMFTTGNFRIGGIVISGVVVGGIVIGGLLLVKRAAIESLAHYSIHKVNEQFSKMFADKSPENIVESFDAMTKARDESGGLILEWDSRYQTAAKLAAEAKEILAAKAATKGNDPSKDPNIEKATKALEVKVTLLKEQMYPTPFSHPDINPPEKAKAILESLKYPAIGAVLTLTFFAAGAQAFSLADANAFQDPVLLSVQNIAARTPR